MSAENNALPQRNDRWLNLMIILVAACGWWCSVSPSRADDPPAQAFLYPAKGIDPKLLKSDARVLVKETPEYWHFAPAKNPGSTALLFYPGGGVEPTAYAALVRALAGDGTPVYLVRLPGKPAAPTKHKQMAIAQGKTILQKNPTVRRWVVAGHSMGGAIAAQFVHEAPRQFRGLILLGTTHPRDFDLSGFTGEVAKVYATQDNVARFAQSQANKKLLPGSTTWVRIEGGNHAQFGHYGSQAGDGQATISREKQQQLTIEAIRKVLQKVAEMSGD